MSALPRLVLLTDRSQLSLGRGLTRTVAECVAAGLRAVIVREHDLPAPARAALVADLVTLPGLLVISSRIPDPNAHGLHAHTGQGRVDSGGPFGRSCHSRADVARAVADGASWATLSPYAASASKPGPRTMLSTTDFAGHPIPVFALSGIDAGNAAAARAAGAHGIAVMGAVMRDPDPAAVVADLLAAVR